MSVRRVCVPSSFLSAKKSSRGSSLRVKVRTVSPEVPWLMLTCSIKLRCKYPLGALANADLQVARLLCDVALKVCPFSRDSD